MPDATHNQHLDWFSFTDVPKSQTLTPLKSHKTRGYCWRTQKCRNLCIPHAFLEGKKAEEMSPRKSTLGTLKGVRQQYPRVTRDILQGTCRGAETQANVSHLALGKDKAQCLAACFLILPV